MNIGKNPPTSYHERMMSSVLDRIGLDYMCQIVFPMDDKFIRVDFLLDDINTIIEVDGIEHSDRNHIISDARRDEYLKSMGYKIVRIMNEELDMDEYESTIDLVSYRIQHTHNRNLHNIDNTKRLRVLYETVCDSVCDILSKDEITCVELRVRYIYGSPKEQEITLSTEDGESTIISNYRRGRTRRKLDEEREYYIRLTDRQVELIEDMFDVNFYSVTKYKRGEEQ